MHQEPHTINQQSPDICDEEVSNKKYTTLPQLHYFDITGSRVHVRPDGQECEYRVGYPNVRGPASIYLHNLYNYSDTSGPVEASTEAMQEFSSLDIRNMEWPD